MGSERDFLVIYSVLLAFRTAVYKSGLSWSLGVPVSAAMFPFVYYVAIKEPVSFSTVRKVVSSASI